MYNPSPKFLKLVGDLARYAWERGLGLEGVVEVKISREELQSLTPKERGVIKEHIVSSSEQEVIVRASIRGLVGAGLLQLVKKGVSWALGRRRLLWFWVLGSRVLSPYEFEDLYNLDKRTLRTLAYVLGVVDLYHELRGSIKEVRLREGRVIVRYDDVVFDVNFHENTIKAWSTAPEIGLEAHIKKATRLKPVTWLKSVDVYWAMSFVKKALEGEVAEFADFVERETGYEPLIHVSLEVELYDNDIYHGADYDVVEYEINATRLLEEGTEAPATVSSPTTCSRRP